MSTEYFEDFQSKLKLLIVDHDKEKPLIKLCDTVEKSKFYNPEGFNNIYKNFVEDKIKNEKYSTEKNNRFEALNALNVLYLDIDYSVRNDNLEENENNEIEIANIYVDNFINANNIVNYNKYIFIPETIIKNEDKYKCGAHIFIYLDKNITAQDRRKMYTNTRWKISMDADLVNSIEAITEVKLTEENYNKIFDNGPLYSCKSLLLFAEKKNSKRHYKLMVNESIFEHELKILPIAHTNKSEETDEYNTTIQVEDAEIQTYLSDFDYNVHSKIVHETLHFIESLSILCPKHKFWTILGNHQPRGKKIWQPLMKWLCLAEFIEDGFNAHKSYKIIQVKLAEVMLPLFDLCKEYGTRQKENKTLREWNNEISSWCKCMFENDNSKYQLLIDREIGIYSSSFYQTKNITQREKLLTKKVSLYNPELNKQEMNVKINHLNNSFRNITSFAQSIMIDFTAFVNRIMKNLTYEILPTKQNSNIHDKNYYISGEFYTGRKTDFKYFITRLKTLFRMFVAIEHYKTNDVCESVRETILAFVHRFVAKINMDAKTKILIYNVCQIEELFKYPRNQWIEDERGVMVLQWLSHLYDYYLHEELQTNKRVKFLSPFVSLLNTYFGEHMNFKEMETLKDFKATMKKLSADAILKTSINTIITPPVKKDILSNSPYFPMWNVILEFVLDDKKYAKLGLKRGDIIAHEDNYNMYLEGYTCTPYTNPSEYNFKSKEYMRVKRMIEETFMNDEVREYVCMCYAQTLHSWGERDQFHQNYGTGGDGKSVWNNFVSIMLGGIGDEDVETKDYPIKVMRCPYGLSVTVNVEAITQTNKSSHQSGGSAELKNRRFTTVAEPDTKSNRDINVSEIKKLTGGTPMSVRGIYETAEIITPKSYITLQTNQIIGYSETNDAVKRRFAVIPFESKFKTICDNELQTKYKFKADQELIVNINKNPKYWEALFQYLLPYAQKFIRENIGALSEIKKPQKIINLTNESLQRSSGLNGYLLKNFHYKKYSCISVRELIDTIISTNNALKASREPAILDDMVSRQSKSYIENYISNVIDSMFGGVYLYKLKCSYESHIFNEQKLIFPLKRYNDENFEHLFGKREDVLSGITMNGELSWEYIYIIDYELNQY